MGSVRQAVGIVIGAMVGTVVGLATGNVGAGIMAGYTAYGFMTRQQQRKAAQLTNTATTANPMVVVYGRDRVGFAIVDSRSLTTTNNRVAHVGALCLGGEDGAGIDAIEEIRLGDRLAVSSPVIGAYTQVSTGEFAGNWMYYSAYLGSDAQTVDSLLASEFPTNWPSTSRLVGVAYLALFLRTTGEESPFAGGLPNVTATVRGVRVYDPRDLTWKWSDNPALCIRDYLTSVRYGCAIPTSELDEQSFIDAANYADELVAIPGGTQKRFTCNGSLSTDRALKDNLDELLSSCRGRLVYQGGVFRLVVRRPTTAGTFALDRTNIVGDWSFRRAGAREVANSIRAGWFNPAAQYLPAEVIWPAPGVANGFLTADNDVLSEKEIGLAFTQNRYEAEQHAMVALRESRYDLTVQLTATEAALAAQVGDVVPITHEVPGWTAKLFRVDHMTLLPDSQVRLTLQEYSDDAYVLDALDTAPPIPGDGLPNPFTCIAPTGLTLTSSLATAVETEGNFLPAILAEWTASVDPFLDGYHLRYRRTAEIAYHALPDARAADVVMNVLPVTAGIEYVVEVQAFNTLGVTSAWVPGTITVGAAESPLDIHAWSPAYTDASGDTVPFVGTTGALVTEVHVYERLLAQGAAEPWSTLEDAAYLTATLTPSSRAISHTFDAPPEDYIRYFLLAPYSERADGTLTPGNTWRGTVLPKNAQPPVVEVDTANNGEMGTMWLKVQTRGILVTAITAQSQTGTQAATTPAAPARDVGDASTVRGGTLGAGEYEQDATLDSYDFTTITFTLTLATGEVMTVERAFNKNRVPDFVSAPVVSGTTVSWDGDDKTVSSRIERTDGGGTWALDFDWWAGTADVTDTAGGAGVLASNTIGTYRITLYSDPVADRDVNSLTATADVEVTNGTSTEPTWTTMTIAIPVLTDGTDDEATITLVASAAPVGYTAQVWARWQEGGGAWTDYADITAALSPALSAPPTASTAYTWASGFPRIAKDTTQPVVSFEFKAEILNGSSARVASRVEPKQWYSNA